MRAPHRQHHLVSPVSKRKCFQSKGCAGSASASRSHSTAYLSSTSQHSFVSVVPLVALPPTCPCQRRIAVTTQENGPLGVAARQQACAARVLVRCRWSHARLAQGPRSKPATPHKTARWSKEVTMRPRLSTQYRRFHLPHAFSASQLCSGCTVARMRASQDQSPPVNRVALVRGQPPRERAPRVLSPSRSPEGPCTSCREDHSA